VGTLLANLSGVITRRLNRRGYRRSFSLDNSIDGFNNFLLNLLTQLEIVGLRLAALGLIKAQESAIYAFRALAEWLCYNFAPMDSSRRTNPTRPMARRRRQSSLPSWAIYGLGAFFVAATLFSAYLVYATVRDFVASWGGSESPGQVVGPNIITQTAQASGSEGATAVPIAPISAQTWNGVDRVTILLMGIDQREGETDTAYRTDSMMLVTVDPVGRTAGILSIPRDLYVEIPGFPDRDKITTANFKGDAYHLPGGGPKTAMDTVELNLGIRVNYYIRINFTAFETLVDLIGGIEVDNPYEINDPEYPDCCFGYDPFYLAAGTQHLDGATALKFARTRHTLGDDFGRAERQQMVVMAVRDKVLSTDMLPVLFGKAPQLLDTLSGSYQTNLSVDQIASLAMLAKEIPRDNIQTAVIDQDYIAQIYSPDGVQEVLVLNIEKFRELRDTMFYVPEPPQISVPNAGELLTTEAARVEVLNGTLTPGLAKSATEYLLSKGMNVVSVGNAEATDYGTTIIYDYTGKPYTAQWLAEVFHISSSSIVSGNNPDSDVDVRIILGADFILPNQ